MCIKPKIKSFRNAIQLYFKVSFKVKGRIKSPCQSIGFVKIESRKEDFMVVGSLLTVMISCALFLIHVISTVVLISFLVSSIMHMKY